jgi:hypothetical protein
MVIDMKKMEIHLEGELLGEEINSCSRLVKFVDDTCDYGTKCCKKCSEPFTNFMSCLVDDMLVSVRYNMLHTPLNISTLITCI